MVRRWPSLGSTGSLVAGPTVAGPTGVGRADATNTRIPIVGKDCELRAASRGRSRPAIGYGGSRPRRPPPGFAGEAEFGGSRGWRLPPDLSGVECIRITSGPRDRGWSILNRRPQDRCPPSVAPGVCPSRVRPGPTSAHSVRPRTRGRPAGAADVPSAIDAWRYGPNPPMRQSPHRQVASGYHRSCWRLSRTTSSAGPATLGQLSHSTAYGQLGSHRDAVRPAVQAGQ